VIPAASQTSTERVRLARLAEATLIASARVVATAGPDGRWVTADAGRPIDGVVAVAEPSGRVEIGLHADAVWPVDSLEALAEHLREQLRNAAAAAGLGGAVGSIAVCFHDMVEPVAYPELA